MKITLIDETESDYEFKNSFIKIRSLDVEIEREISKLIILSFNFFINKFDEISAVKMRQLIEDKIKKNFKIGDYEFDILYEKIILEIFK